MFTVHNKVQICMTEYDLIKGFNPMPPDAKMADSLTNPERREATPHGMHTYQTK